MEVSLRETQAGYECYDDFVTGYGVTEQEAVFAYTIAKSRSSHLNYVKTRNKGKWINHVGEAK